MLPVTDPEEQGLKGMSADSSATGASMDVLGLAVAASAATEVTLAVGVGAGMGGKRESVGRKGEERTTSTADWRPGGKTRQLLTADASEAITS